MDILGAKKICILGKQNQTTKIDIDGVVYYAKQDDDFLEVICSRLANICGIPCFQYEPVVIDEAIAQKLGKDFFPKNRLPDNTINYVFSKDISYCGDFISARKKFPELNRLCSLYDIWNSIEKNYPDNTKKLMTEIVRMYIFDYFIMNDDRETLNYGILNSDTVVVFDHQASFTVWTQTITTEDAGFYDSKFVDIGIFLKTSSQEFVDLFENMLIMIPPKILNVTIKQIEHEYNIKIEKKLSFQAKYRINYNKIINVFNNLKYGSEKKIK